MHLPSWGAFQRSLTLLVRYRSQVVFSLGRQCRPRSRGVSSPRYSGSDPGSLPPDTGLSPCIALRSRRLLERSRPVTVSPNTTLPTRSEDLTGFGLDCVAFTRRYWRHRIRFLFLPLLRCFNSGRSPLREAIAGGFPFGNPWFFASVRLPTAYRSLARPSSAPEPSHPPAGIVATMMFGSLDVESEDSTDVSSREARRR